MKKFFDLMTQQILEETSQYFKKTILTIYDHTTQTRVNKK